MNFFIPAGVICFKNELFFNLIEAVEEEIGVLRGISKEEFQKCYELLQKISQGVDSSGGGARMWRLSIFGAYLLRYES